MSVASPISYEYPLADTLHAVNPRIQTGAKAHCPFIVSTDRLDITRMMAPEHIAHYVEEPAAKFIKKKCGKANFKTANSSVLEGLKTVSKEKNFLTRLQKLSNLLREESETLVESFANTLIDQITGLTSAASFDKPDDSFISKQLTNFKNVLRGAFDNAFATTLGLAYVIAEKFPAPKIDEDGAFAKYKKEFSNLLNRNTFLLRNIARFHYDLQNLFQNTNGILNKNKHPVYAFKPDNFVLETTSQTRGKKRLTLSPEYIDKLKAKLEHDLVVIDYDDEKMFNYNTPVRGCPTLELETEHGNFFNKFAMWINSFVTEILLTKNNEQETKVIESI